MHVDMKTLQLYFFGILLIGVSIIILSELWYLSGIVLDIFYIIVELVCKFFDGFKHE